MADRDLCGYSLGGFVLRERIDAGGSSTVYRGEQWRPRRDVVVKVLEQELYDDDESRQRFFREARLASRLNHPFAAHIYAFGVVDQGGPAWIAMELVSGVTLKRWLAMHGPIALEKFVPLFERIALVVQTAHDLGIVHRDLKPSNVMVVEIEGQLVPKLLDFGIAKVHQKAVRPPPDIEQAAPVASVLQPRTRTHGSDLPVTREPLTPHGAKMGSPAYMAPEQWTNAVAAGPGADIYSLGILAYEALTGDPPFVAETDDEYYACHLYDPVPEIFSPALDPILQRALAKEPHARHRTVRELASELRAALDASEPAQIRSAAQRWDDQGRPVGLLWGGDVLANVKNRVKSSALSELDCSFVAASHRRARRFRWLWRSLVAIGAIVAVGAVLYDARMQARMARQREEATTTKAALEQGRAALLHGEPEARTHLAEAYKRDPAPSTAFMLARALQALLAEQLQFASSKGRIWSAMFSPDGSQIVTTDDQCAQVRDAQTGQLRFTLSHGDTVYQAVYSPGGTQLITAGGDGTVKIWEAATGTLERELTHAGRKFRYFAVAASADGKLVAAIDRTGEVAHVWDAATGAPLGELRNDTSEAPSLAFSADGRWLATSGGNDVRVFDTHTWTRARLLAGPGVHDLSWDPTGPRLLTGSSNGDTSIWEIPSGVRVHHLRELGAPVDAVAFSPDGMLVVAASRDGAEQVWSAVSGVAQSQGNYLRDKIRFIEFDPTSKLIVAAGTSGEVAVSEAAQEMPITVLEGPRNVVWAAHFDPSSRRVIGASWDGTARVWDATSPYRQWNAPPISDDCGFVTSLEPDRRFIAIGCRDHKTQIWDTAHDKLLAELPGVTQIGGDFAPTFPAVSAEGDRAAIARDNAVEVYELPGGRLLRTIEHPAAVHAVAFASTGHDLASGDIDGSLRLTHDGQDSLALPRAPDGIDAIAWLPDGRVVVADAGKRLRAYAPGGAILAEFDVSARVLSLRISPEGDRAVTLPSYMNKLAMPMLLDLERYHVITVLEGHIGRVFSARFEVGQIITAGADGTARRWDGTSGQLVQTYRGSARFLADATLTPDGSMVVAGGGDGMLRFWDTATADPLWRLPAHKSHLIGIHFEGTAIVTRGFSGDLARWVLPRSEDVIRAFSAREAALSSPP